MRPSGGFTPDMYNFAYETDVYKIWADMIAFNKCTLNMDRPRHFCAFVGRRDGRNYAMDHNAIMETYGAGMKLQCRLPDALAAAMGNQVYMCNFDREEDVWSYFSNLMRTNNG